MTQPKKTKQKFFLLLMPALAAILLLNGCKGGAVQKTSTDEVAERPQIKSATAPLPLKLAVGTQQGGARQGANLNLKTVVSTLAGKASMAGAADGISTRARFDAPKGITTDGINLYVADLNNHTIRKIDIASGMVSTIAGLAGKKGSSDGRGAATDGSFLYVSDSNNHSVRQIDIESGVVTTLAGGVGEVGYVDGRGSLARFFIPEGITTDGTNLYVADTHNHSVRKIELESAIVTTFAGLSGAPGFLDDVGTKARFSYPKGITTDGRNLFVADFGNHRIRKISLSSASVSTLAGSSREDGPPGEQGELARFNYPTGITTDGRNLYVANTFNRTVRKISIAGGTVSNVAGKEDFEGAIDAGGSEARFKDPVGITSDGSYLYVTDSGSNTVRKIR
jgi:DNA-binding beta-propeller fold protein YncE